jgi:hypothetical protein
MLITMMVTAQSSRDHLTFMGIPLTGNINSFQAKLIKKGCKLDRNNKYISIGCRLFKGRFAGENASIFIYYNEDSKVVYRAKAVLNYSEKSILEQKYNEIAQMLKLKYADEMTKSGEQDNHETTTIYVSDDFGTYLKGEIDIYVPKIENSYLYGYDIHIDYSDFANSTDNTSSKMDDL